MTNKALRIRFKALQLPCNSMTLSIDKLLNHKTLHEDIWVIRIQYHSIGSTPAYVNGNFYLLTLKLVFYKLYLVYKTLNLSIKETKIEFLNFETLSMYYSRRRKTNVPKICVQFYNFGGFTHADHLIKQISRIFLWYFNNFSS